MNPPSEQLIRDYLNRMSVAARRRLGFRDRQALLDQTRMQIEIACGGLSTASAEQVRKVLAGLGDPVAAVECEHARIAGGSELHASSESNGGVRSRAPVVRAQQLLDAPVRAGRPAPDGTNGAGVAGAAGVRTARDVPGSDGAPAVGGARAAGKGRGMGATRDVPGPGGVPAVSEVLGTSGVPAVSEVLGTGGVPAVGGTRAPGTGAVGASGDVAGADGLPVASAPATGSAAGRPLVPPPAVSPESAERGFYAAPNPSAESGSGPRRESAEGSGSMSGPTPAGSGAGRPASTGRVGSATASTLGRLWQFADGAAVLARRNPLEAIALVLMGVGGAVYPPVWLLGAGLALTSKTWDLRDKWIGLATPVLLVIVGMVLALILGGTQRSFGSYAFEIWLSAGRVSRGASVLGAAYLLWRLHRGPREPRQPPWNVPRRLG